MLEIIKKTVKNLRDNETEAEKILWQELRNRKLVNLKFLRQHPIIFRIDNQDRFFVADFYCYSANLVIELDGKIHEKQQDYDLLRSAIINKLGLNIIRFKNEEILTDLRMVLDKIIHESI